jgi:cytoplasmic iron level regulating protein YaaA (DUF328/UPF0246 family)
MLILISPAKTLDLTSSFKDELSEPRFAGEAARLARAASRLGAPRLAELMHISPKLAELNAARFKNFAKAEPRPAIRMFAGDVYRGFDIGSADSAVLDFAQDHLRILSGLYGVVRPLDAIRPYRLEMGTPWSPTGGTLVDFWGRKVAKALLADLAHEGSNVVLNLASREYFAVIGPYLKKKVQLITPDFRVRTAKGLAFHSFTAKVARGALARFVCDERIDTPEGLTRFDRDGWKFEQSTPIEAPLFLRQ